jgi:hypothetical protein
MGGRIDCYIDVGKSQQLAGPVKQDAMNPAFPPSSATNDMCLSASFYGYIGFIYLMENLKTLEDHGVQVEYVNRCPRCIRCITHTHNLSRPGSTLFCSVASWPTRVHMEDTSPAAVLISHITRACLVVPELTSIPGEGNKPPWLNQVKAKYGVFEGRRASARAGKPEMQFPDDLMSQSHTVLVNQPISLFKGEGEPPTIKSVSRQV